MTHTRRKPVAETRHPSQKGLPITLMPTEDRQSIEDLEREVRSELAPKSAYEHILTKDIVSLTQEIQRNRNFRDYLIRSEFRELSIKTLSGKNIDDTMGLLLASSEDIELVDALMLGVDSKKIEECHSKFAEKHETPNEILARAVQREHLSVDMFDSQIQSLERRRRILMKEYRKLFDANREST